MADIKNDYKASLNLPHTDFPMKADLAKREPLILEKWHSVDIYQALRDKCQGRPSFILHDGPPYANGPIHLGTAVNKTLKDIIVKSKILSGFNAPFVPGWDCHGLPIELYVEKKLGKPGSTVSAKEFRKACRLFAASQVALQKQAFQRLGVIGDWENPYLTMNFQVEADTLRALAKIIAKGNVERGYRPVHWCLDCSSSLAEAEVEYADKHSLAIDVAFLVYDVRDLAGRLAEEVELTKVYLPIWTTTPWTLPANEAVAVNPLINYAIVNAGKYGQLIIAHPLIAGVMQRYEISDYQILSIFPGDKLEHLILEHPLYHRQVPVILGQHVTVDAGTGAVHTAPAHGYDDFIIGRKYGLPVKNPVEDNGCFSSDTLFVAGLHVSKSNQVILDELRNRGLLLKDETITHSYPHCWRHKTPVIFRTTPQWFINLEKNNLRSQALAAIEQVNWLPGWGQARITHMIAQRGDWCISRQRAWGVPMALLVHKHTGELHPNTLQIMEQVAQRIELKGIEAWYDLDFSEVLGDDLADYVPCMDTLDVWFDSGVTHETVLAQNKQLGVPADLYLEGSDQHRGWFNSSLLTAIAICEQAPYKSVLTHGYVIDLEGRKMSKSLGNVLDPLDVVNSLGADILRLWVASIDYRAEINASHEIFTRTAETYRRLRNTARFLLANLCDFDPHQHVLSPDNMLALDIWALEKASIVQNEIISAYADYKLHLVYQKLHNFCTVDMGSFYLDIIKDRQYTMPKNSDARRSAQTAMYHIILAMTHWLAPILSFTAEEVWQYLPGNQDATESSVFFNTWYELPSLGSNRCIDYLAWENIKLVRDAVNKEIESQRNLGTLGSSLEAEVIIYCAGSTQDILQSLEDELKFVLITSSATVQPLSNKADDAILTGLTEELWLSIKKTDAAKCQRCWHRAFSVESHPDYPGLCARCVTNVAGDGEVRLYA